MKRQYAPAPTGHTGSHRNISGAHRPTSDELHAWSIYRQNLNSEFTDSALGSSDKSPLPYGNFQLRETTVNSILQHPKYGPKSELGANMYTYLKYGLPRVFPPSRPDGSSGYDSSDDGAGGRRYRRAKSNPDLRGVAAPASRSFGDSVFRGGRKNRSSSEANLLAAESVYSRGVRSPDVQSDLAGQSVYVQQLERRRPPSQRSRAGSHASLLSRLSRGPGAVGSAGFSRRHDGTGYGKEPPMLNDKLFPKDQMLGEAKGPHLQVRDLHCDRRVDGAWRRLVEGATFEARSGDLVGIMTTSGKYGAHSKER